MTYTMTTYFQAKANFWSLEMKRSLFIRKPGIDGNTPVKAQF